jgi:hypothetical protein
MPVPAVLRDSHGIPAPKIDYTISENTRRMMEHGIARASEILAMPVGARTEVEFAMDSPRFLHRLGQGSRSGDRIVKHGRESRLSWDGRMKKAFIEL